MPYGSNNPAISLEDFEAYCDECCEGTNYYYGCQDCDQVFCEDCWCNLNSGDYYCGRCLRENDDAHDAPCRGVHGYNYTPDFCPKGDTSHTMMGVELEVGDENGRNVVNAVQAIDADEDHLYMKEDGSIQGVEIVTHPMTLEWAREYRFDEMLRGLRNNGCWTDDHEQYEYGLHIHVGRDSFRRSKNRSSQMHGMAWLMFIHRNADQLKKLSRRGAVSKYAKFDKPQRGELKNRAAGPTPDLDRRVAVNTNNRDTVELRFFHSTLDEQEFWASLEFAEASLQYTAGISSSAALRGGALAVWDRFTDWCGERAEYANLSAQIEALT